MKKNLVPHNFFVKWPVFLAITAGLIGLDWFTFSSLFGAFSSDDSSMQICGALVLAVAIDVGPMIAAHFLADRCRAKIISRICIIAVAMVFVTAVTGMGLMRIVNSDTIIQASETSGQESKDLFAKAGETAVTASADTVTAAADNGIKQLNRYAQIIFTLSPIFTSVVAFCLSCLRSQYKLRLDIQGLERHIEDLNAEALTIKNSNLINSFEYENENEGQRMISLNQALAEVDSINQSLKQKIRDIYTDHCNVLIHAHQAQLVPITASPEYYPQRLSAPSEMQFSSAVSLPGSVGVPDEPGPRYDPEGETDE